MLLKPIFALLLTLFLNTTSAQGINCEQKWVCGQRTVTKCEGNYWGRIECKPTVVDDCRNENVCEGRKPKRCRTEWICGKRTVSRCENTFSGQDCKNVVIDDCRDQQFCK